MAAANTFMSYLVENEETVYSTLRATAIETRRAITEAFAEEGIAVRFAGDKDDVLPGNSLHMLRVLGGKDTGSTRRRRSTTRPSATWC